MSNNMDTNEVHEELELLTAKDYLDVDEVDCQGIF